MVGRSDVKIIPSFGTFVTGPASYFHEEMSFLVFYFLFFFASLIFSLNRSICHLLSFSFSCISLLRLAQCMLFFHFDLLATSKWPSPDTEVRASWHVLGAPISLNRLCLDFDPSAA